ncbi:hypothetical protein TWF281_008233 [Arthrobotrys megalospora]
MKRMRRHYSRCPGFSNYKYYYSYYYYYSCNPSSSRNSINTILYPVCYRYRYLQYHQSATNYQPAMDPPSQHVQQQWTDKLVGKKIVDSPSDHPEHFCKQDLPQGVQAHRVIAPGTMVTKDFRPSRMNVHVDDDGTCTHINFG